MSETTPKFTSIAREEQARAQVLDDIIGELDPDTSDRAQALIETMLRYNGTDVLDRVSWDLLGDAIVLALYSPVEQAVAYRQAFSNEGNG